MTYTEIEQIACTGWRCEDKNGRCVEFKNLAVHRYQTFERDGESQVLCRGHRVAMQGIGQIMSLTCVCRALLVGESEALGLILAYYDPIDALTSIDMFDFEALDFSTFNAEYWGEQNEGGSTGLCCDCSERMHAAMSQD